MSSLNLHPDFKLPSFCANGQYDNGDMVHDTFTVYYCMMHAGANRNSASILGEQLLAECLQMPKPNLAAALLTTADGWPVRSPEPYWWHGRAGRVSRDSLTPFLCFFAALQNKPQKNIDQCWWQLLLPALRTKWYVQANNIKPNFRYDTPAEHVQRSTPDVPFEPQKQMPDILGPDMWTVIMRACHPKSGAIFRFFLCLLDLHGLGAAIQQYYWPKTDCRNQILKVHFSATYSPTFISKLTWKLLKAGNVLEQAKKHFTAPGRPAIHRFLKLLLLQGLNGN